MTREEAIARIREAMPTLWKGTKDAIQTLIPELRESEDERIRKWIIEEFKLHYDFESKSLNPMVEKALAWLEKQKEQTEDLSTRLNGVMQEYVKEGKDEEEQEHRLKCYQLFWDALGDSEFFKQKEQKPAIKLVFPRFRVGDIIRNVHDEWDKTTKRISYVGEHGYNFDYRHLRDNAGGGSFGFCYEDYYELLEQKPAEWSEEDEKRIMK